MVSLPLETWLRFLDWLTFGLVIYCFRGMKRTATPPTCITPSVSAGFNQQWNLISRSTF